MPDDYEELAQMYRPTGACAQCDHPATEIWLKRTGSQAFEFRCACCVALGKLERARKSAAQIAKLETEYASAKAACWPSPDDIRSGGKS